MRYYVNWQCPLYHSEHRQGKWFDIPVNAFIEILWGGNGMQYVRYNNKEGYVEDRFIEEYHQELPHNCVDLTGIQTATTDDFEQYIIWGGVKQVNMCGEMCAAVVFEVGLADVLVNWQGKQPSIFKRIFGKGKATGTNNADLITIFEIYGAEAKKINLKKYTPTTLRDMVEKHHLICGVKMHATTGALRGGSVAHWVLIQDVKLERKGFGFVQVYNPAMNCCEVYSWAEWVAAAGVPYGVMVRKDF